MEPHKHYRPQQLDYLNGLNDLPVIIGPRKVVSASDASDRSLAASATVQVSIAMETLQAGSWLQSASDQGIILEKFVAGIQFRDAAPQIQVLAMNFNNGLTPMNMLFSLPFTAPGVANYTAWITILQRELILRDTEPATLTQGPQMLVIVKNLDGAAAHTYRLVMYGLVRHVSNVYLTGHVQYEA